MHYNNTPTTPTNPHQSNAIRLHGYGANVLSLDGEKTPILRTWRLWTKKPQDQDDVLIQDWPRAAGVGVVHGINAWRSFDIDWFKGQDGEVPTEVVQKMLEVLGLPHDYRWLVRSGSLKGRQIHFRCHGELPTSLFPLKRGKDTPKAAYWGTPLQDGLFDHIELRWHNCQTVVPPSLHPSGNRYEFINGEPDGPPAVVPIEKVVMAFLSIAKPKEFKGDVEPEDLRQARDVRELVEGDADLNRLIEQVKGCIDLAAFAEHLFGGTAEREPDGQLRIAGKGHGGLIIDPEAGRWFLHAEEVGGGFIQLAAYAQQGPNFSDRGKHFIDALRLACEFAGVTFPERERHVDTAPTVDTDEVEFEGPATIEEPVQSSFPPLPESARLPEELGKGACGWLDEYERFSRYWSPRSYDGFHTAAGLWLLSTVSARRVMTHMGKRRFGNLNIALCARSSVWAKSSAADIASEVLRDAGLDFLLGSDETTPQALIASMAGKLPGNYGDLPMEDQERARARVAFAAQRGWYYDEFGQKLSAMMRENGVMADFRGLLRKFDDNRDVYQNETIGRGIERVERPYLALLASLTPADMEPFAKRGSSLWGDGFFARFGFVVPPLNVKPPKGRFPDGKRVTPASILRALREWHQRLGVPQVRISSRQDGKTKVYDVEVEPVAPVECQLGEGVKDAFYRYHDALIELVAGMESTDTDGNYARFAEKALRVAMLMASLENNGVIEMRYWARAQQITESWRADLHNLMDTLRSGDGVKSPGAEREQKVLAVVHRLRSADSRPSFNEIRRYTNMGVDELKATVNGLVSVGALKQEPGKRVGSFWYDIPGLQVNKSSKVVGEYSSNHLKITTIHTEPDENPKSSSPDGSYYASTLLPYYPSGVDTSTGEHQSPPTSHPDALKLERAAVALADGDLQTAKATVYAADWPDTPEHRAMLEAVQAEERKRLTALTA